jgi:hypoxanthine phosphoribosyltransferase
MEPHHIKDILFSEQQIKQRVEVMVKEMAEECRNTSNFVMIGILRGSFMFFADLVRELNRDGVHARIDFTTLESYGSGTESSGIVKVVKDFTVDVTGCNVFIVDDILDTGRTLTFAKNYLFEKGAASVKTCVLLDKPSRRIVPVKADHVGFEIEDTFVVGYGLDYDSYYRELPYIAKVTFTE